MPQGLIFLTHKHESVVLTDNIKETKRPTNLIQDDMQNKFLKSIHFTVLSFPEAAAKPAPRLPFSSHPLSQGAQVGSSSCPCPPSSSCLPGLRADLADLCFWEVANFRHQCPDHTQESIFLLLNNTAEVSQGRGFINSPPKIPAVTAN